MIVWVSLALYNKYNLSIKEECDIFQPLDRNEFLHLLFYVHCALTHNNKMPDLPLTTQPKIHQPNPHDVCMGKKRSQQ